MADPLLVFERVAFRSEEGKAVLQEADWTLERGAKVKVRATPGHHAVALLRLAAGLAAPQEGRIVLDGVPLGPYAFDHPFLKRGALGWVPRDGGLLVNQSLLANVALPLMFTKRTGRAAAEALAESALADSGLGDLAACRPHALDQGERWLGGLVRASVMAPELWLIDHPPLTLSRGEREAAIVILGRAGASAAAVLMAGEAAWIPEAPWQTVGLDNGRLVPEDA